MQINVVEIKSPELEFGDDQRTFADPREGLTSAGPFSLRFGKAHKSEVRLGVIGTAALLPAARAWYKLCETQIATRSLTNPCTLISLASTQLFSPGW